MAASGIHTTTKAAGSFWKITQLLWHTLMLPRRLKISHLLFFSHMLLVLWLIGMLSYNRYQSEWQTRIDHSVEVAHLALNPIIDDLSLYASGLNYGNINLPATRKLFGSADKLLYFQVNAVSDFSQTEFHFAYSKDNNEVWQTGLTEEAAAAARDQIQKLETLMQRPGADLIKYGFLLNRARERYESVVADRAKTEQYRSLYHKPALSLGQHVLDKKTRTLHTLLPLRNASGGEIWAVFNANNLLELEDQMIRNISLEALFAFLVSSILILWATWWIVQPLRRLANYMDHEIHELDVAVLPELSRDDEIGLLARCFKNLINRIRGQISDLERLAVIDPLTSLGSRRLYETSGRSFLKQTKRSALCFGMLVCDVDHFKKYNDTYGHAQGDEALKMIGRIIKEILQRETDLAYRIGGEEFVVLMQVRDVNEVEQIAEKLRQAILSEKMEHTGSDTAGVVSVSIGGIALTPTQARPYQALDTLFRKADQALYRAKAQGRNRVEMV